MPATLTTAEFVEKAKAVHGDRYDYSRVEYLNNYTKVTIVCPEHGPFEQIPSTHVRDHGCPDCGSNKLTTESFIGIAKTVHGDRYDYSLVDYVRSNTNVTIICPEHGPFEQTPNNHLANKGCIDCGGRKQLNTERFIEKARSHHGERFDYSAVKYVNNTTKVTILCPDHGPFTQTPSNHLSKGRKIGCPDCAGRNTTTEKFIAKALAIHTVRYDYSKVDYVNARANVTIICRDHGPFRQTPTDHLAGKGCGDCAGNKPLTTNTFIERARAIHSDYYDYSRVEYVNTGTRVTIICPDHGPFLQAPNEHIYQASGCADCADTGFNPGESGMLYYIAVTTDHGDTRYKIGITNNSIEKRFRAPDFARIRVVCTWRYAIGRAAAEREAEIIRQYAGDKYDGPPILLSGNTELFTHDILGLDK